MLTSKNRLQLLDELAQHKRFKNCKLSHFINDIDPELQKQFAAIDLPPHSRYLSMSFVGLMTVSLAGRKIST